MSQLFSEQRQLISLGESLKIDDDVDYPLVSHHTAFASKVNKALTPKSYHIQGRHITGGFGTPINSGPIVEQLFEYKEAAT